MRAGLDRGALSEWCRRRLGSEPEQVLFEAGYLSQVVGLRLANGMDVVVKVRGWQERLTGCGQVQHSLSVAGFPAPPLLVPPERLGQLGVSAEALVPGGALLASERDSAGRFAEGLALLVRSAPALRRWAHWRRPLHGSGGITRRKTFGPRRTIVLMT